MTEVELPDGTVLEFPESMSKEDIRDVLRRKYSGGQGGYAGAGTAASEGQPAQPQPQQRRPMDTEGTRFAPGTTEEEAARVPPGMVYDPQTGGYVDAGLRAQRMDLPLGMSAVTSPGAIANVLQGAPFIGSWMDEAFGLLGGEKDAETFRQAAEQYQESNPGRATTARVAGGILGSAPIAKVASMVGPAVASASRGGRAIQAGIAGLLGGGVEGAVYGSGEAEGMGRAGNAATQGAIGAVTGGLLGTAAPYAAEGISALYQRLRGSDVRQIASALGISPNAARVVRSAFDGGDMAAAERAIQEAGAGAMLADASQPARELLDAAAQSGGRAGQIVTEAVEGRAAEAGRQMRDVMDRSLGAPQSVDDVVRGVRTGTAAARGAAYDAAYAAPIDYSSEAGRKLEELLARVPKSALNQARKLMEAEGVESGQRLARIGRNGSVQFETLPDVRQLDYITRGLNEVADMADGKGKLGGQTQLGRVYSNLSREIRNTVGDAVPEYRAALDTASDAISQVSAAREGGAMLRPNVTLGEVAQSFAQATEAEKKAARSAVRGYLDNVMGNARRAASDGNMDAREALAGLRELSSRNSRDKLAILLGPKAADDLLSQIDTLGKALELRAATARNSATAIRQQIQGSVRDIAGPNAFETLGEGKPIEAARQVLQNFTGSTAELRALREQGIFEEIARSLTQRRGREAQNDLRLIRRAMEGTALKEEDARRLGSLLSSYAAVAGSRETTRRLTTP